MSALRTTDLVAGLERFAHRYEAIDVYAADVAELFASTDGWSVPRDWKPLGQNRFALSVDANSYVAELKPEIGVLRLQRADRDPSSNNAIIGALSGAAIGSLLSKKPEAVLGGAIVGLLLASSQSSVKRVFTMRFDASGQWRAYSGPLIPVMKESLGRSG